MNRLILPQPLAGQFDRSRNRIPRPMNAFMIFANIHRPDLRARMPELSNTEISVKLGEIWSSMTEEEKEIYFRKSKQQELEHYHRYPDYRYAPKVNKRDSRPLQQEEMPHPYMPVDHDAIDESYYGRFLGERITSADQTKRQLKRKNLLQPAPSVFQIPRPSRLKEDRSQPDQDQYYMPDHQDRQPYMYPYSSGQPMFSSRFIESVYRQTPRHRYNQKPSEREVMTMYSQPWRFPYTVPSRETTEYHLRKLQDYPRATAEYHDVMSSYMTEGSNLDIDHGDSLMDEECQRAVESITSEMNQDPESGSDSIRDEETNYVMIPCDVNIARMLGWPVHMLQRVSQSMLERIQQESIRSLELENRSGIYSHDNQPSPDSVSEPSSTSQTSENTMIQQVPSTGHQNIIQNTNDDEAKFEACLPESKRRCLDNSLVQNKDLTETEVDLPSNESKSAPRQSLSPNEDDLITEPNMDDLSTSNTNKDKTPGQETAESKDQTSLADVDGAQYGAETGRELDVFPPQQNSPADDVKVESPMDSEFKGFPSSELEDELESIDTTSMSASFGQLDSESIAAYQLSNSQGSDKMDSFVQ